LKFKNGQYSGLKIGRNPDCTGLNWEELKNRQAISNQATIKQAKRHLSTVTVLEEEAGSKQYLIVVSMAFKNPSSD